MDELCIFYDSNLGFVPAICCGEALHTEITSDRFEGPRKASCIGMTPEEVTGRRYKIFVEDDFFNKTHKYWFK